MKTSLTVKDLLTGISGLAIATNADLGSAATLATQMKRLFVDLADRNAVVTALADLKTRVVKSPLKKDVRENTIETIDDTITTIEAQPDVMPAMANGAGTDVSQTAASQADSRATA